MEAFSLRGDVRSAASETFDALVVTVAGLPLNRYMHNRFDQVLSSVREGSQRKAMRGPGQERRWQEQDEEEPMQVARPRAHRLVAVDLVVSSVCRTSTKCITRVCTCKSNVHHCIIRSQKSRDV